MRTTAAPALLAVVLLIGAARCSGDATTGRRIRAALGPAAVQIEHIG